MAAEEGLKYSSAGITLMAIVPTLSFFDAAPQVKSIVAPSVHGITLEGNSHEEHPCHRLSAPGCSAIFYGGSSSGAVHGAESR
jgi:hypothetical protein